MGHVTWTPIVREPREAEGTALGKRTIGAALRAVAAAWKTFREGLRSKSVPLLPPARGTEEGTRQKMSFKCRIQLNSSHMNHNSAGWVIVLPCWRIWRVSTKKLFHCFKNGEKLSPSKSFIVSSSKTPDRSCEGWR